MRKPIWPRASSCASNFYKIQNRNKIRILGIPPTAKRSSSVWTVSRLLCSAQSTYKTRWIPPYQILLKSQGPTRWSRSSSASLCHNLKTIVDRFTIQLKTIIRMWDSSRFGANRIRFLAQFRKSIIPWRFYCSRREVLSRTTRPSRERRCARPATKIHNRTTHTERQTINTGNMFEFNIKLSSSLSVVL